MTSTNTEDFTLILVDIMNFDLKLWLVVAIGCRLSDQLRKA